MENSILQLFPAQRRRFWTEIAGRQKDIREIRLRVNRPIMINCTGKEFYVNSEGNPTHNPDEARTIGGGELEELLEHICHYSLYAYEEELRQGFLTVAGGHRIGVAGQAVMSEGGDIRTIRNIRFLNIRVAHEVKGAADRLLSSVYDDGDLLNTLIISPPGCGKTTLLRDLVRQVSNGNPYGRGMTVGVADERSEIAGAYGGEPQNDVGIRTDVLDNCPKEKAMMLLLRSMSPEVIAIDELGKPGELEALRSAAACGCRILATAHGNGVEDLDTRFGRGSYKSLFHRIVLLDKKKGAGCLREVLRGGVGSAQDSGKLYDPDWKFGNGIPVSK